MRGSAAARRPRPAWTCHRLRLRARWRVARQSESMMLGSPASTRSSLCLNLTLDHVLSALPTNPCPSHRRGACGCWAGSCSQDWARSQSGRPGRRTASRRSSGCASGCTTMTSMPRAAVTARLRRCCRRWRYGRRPLPPRCEWGTGWSARIFTATRRSPRAGATPRPRRWRSRLC